MVYYSQKFSSLLGSGVSKRKTDSSASDDELSEIKMAVSCAYNAFLKGSAEDRKFADSMAIRILKLPRRLRYQSIGLFANPMKTAVQRQRARTVFDNFEAEVEHEREAKQLWVATYNDDSNIAERRQSCVRFSM